MKSIRSRILLFLTLLILFSLGCALTAKQAEPSSEAVDQIAAAVAQTLAAEEVEEKLDIPLPTSQPTMTSEPPPPPEANFTYQGVSFYFSDLLAENVTAGTIPGNYDENAPWWSTPEHREYIFNNWVLSDTFHTPTIRVYPVAEFRAINQNVSDGLDVLMATLQTQPSDGADLEVVDLFNAGQLFQSQTKYLKFQNGYGARWLSQYGQAYFPIGWPNLFYTYQGFTDDGKYYISIIFPLNHPSLPHPDNVTLDDAFAENFINYSNEIGAQLNAETDASFVPSLVLLDQLVASLLVGQ
jgi:hypothetical protein